MNKVLEKGYGIFTPYLEQGDVLLLNSLTIHVSLDSQNDQYKG